MKKIILTLASALFVLGASAQSTTAYFTEGSAFRNQLNPALAPLRGYLNLPVIGGFNLTAGGDLSIDELLYPTADGGLTTWLDSTVSSEEALGKFSAKNLLGIDTRINILGFGAFTRNHKNFWSFDIAARVNVEANTPYEFFDFLKRGQSTEIRDLGITADSYLEAGFNYSFPINNRLYVGARIKALVGIARARLAIDSFKVTMNDSYWSAEAKGSLDMAAAGMEIRSTLNENNEEVYNFDDIDMEPTSPAGYGVGLDLGATYDVIPDLQVSLAVNDLGFISWSKMHSGSVEEGIRYEGVEITADGSSKADFDLDDLSFRTTAPAKSAKMLRASVNAGVEYRLWTHRVGVGLLYTARFLEFKTRHNLMAAVNFAPIRWFSMTGSYQFIDNRASAVGLALNICPGWINLYVASDVIVTKKTKQFVPIKQSLMDVTVGLSLPLGKRSHRVEALIKSSDKK